MTDKTEKVIGYTAGCYDLFHIGHLNILRRAAAECDYLVVGVNSDKAMKTYKGKLPIIPESERLEIVKSVRYVDEAVLVDDFVRVDDNGTVPVFEKYRFDKLFIGSDHKEDPRWISVDETLRKSGSRVVYFPYTAHTSSTKLTAVIDKYTEES
jgi:glycerol-3-phosphate cytidylyltransferase